MKYLKLFPLSHYNIIWCSHKGKLGTNILFIPSHQTTCLDSNTSRRTRPSFEKLEAGGGGGGGGGGGRVGGFTFKCASSEHINMTMNSDFVYQQQRLWAEHKRAAVETTAWIQKRFIQRHLLSQCLSANTHFPVWIRASPREISPLSFILLSLHSPERALGSLETDTNLIHSRYPPCITSCSQPLVPCSETSSTLFPGRDFSEPAACRSSALSVRLVVCCHHDVACDYTQLISLSIISGYCTNNIVSLEYRWLWISLSIL